MEVLNTNKVSGKSTIVGDSNGDISEVHLGIGEICAGELDVVVAGSRLCVDLYPVPLVLTDYYSPHFLHLLCVQPHLEIYFNLTRISVLIN